MEVIASLMKRSWGKCVASKTGIWKNSKILAFSVYISTANNTTLERISWFEYLKSIITLWTSELDLNVFCKCYKLPGVIVKFLLRFRAYISNFIKGGPQFTWGECHFPTHTFMLGPPPPWFSAAHPSLPGQVCQGFLLTKLLKWGSTILMGVDCSPHTYLHRGSSMVHKLCWTMFLGPGCLVRLPGYAAAGPSEASLTCFQILVLLLGVNYP